MPVNPAEVWVLDRHGTVRERHVFDRPMLQIAAASSSRVFALGVGGDAYGVYEYRMRADRDQPWDLGRGGPAPRASAGPVDDERVYRFHRCVRRVRVAVSVTESVGSPELVR